MKKGILALALVLALASTSWAHPAKHYYKKKGRSFKSAKVCGTWCHENKHCSCAVHSKKFSKKYFRFGHRVIRRHKGFYADSGVIKIGKKDEDGFVRIIWGGIF